MTQHNTSRDHELWEQAADLQEVLQAIRTAPLPEASLARCMGSAVKLEEDHCSTITAVSSDRDGVRPSIRHAGRWRWPAAIAALFLVTAFISNVLFQKSAWAQVVSTVSEHPWIRLTLQRPADLPEDEEFRTGVIWFTGDRSIAAVQAPGEVVWVDLSSGDQYELMRDAHQIALTKLATRERQLINPLLGALIPFNVGFSAAADNHSVQPTNTAEVSENGRSYLDYSFESKSGDEQSSDVQSDEASKGVIVVRVEKETRQPIHVRWRTAIFAIDYPATGPTDIYALGITRETPLSDLRSMEKFFKPRPNLTHDDYEATEVMVLAGLEGKWLNQASRYSSSGGQLSFAWASLTACMKLAQENYFNDKQEPTGVTHPMDWWHDAVEKLPFEPAEFSDINFPHSRCYNPIGSVQQYDSTVPSRLKGLEGTVELRGKKISVWLDPARDFIVRRLELVGADGSIGVTQYDEVIQDSRGHWFVTHWRGGRVHKRGEQLPTEPTNINGVDVATTVHFARIKFK